MIWSSPPSKPKIAVLVCAGVAAAIALAYLATTFMPETNTRPAPVHFTGAAVPAALDSARADYAHLCASCHGPRGDGKGPWAYRVTPRPANLTSASVRGRGDAALLRAIADGIPGTPMIGWRAQLSDTRREQLLAYVRWLGENVPAARTGAQR